MKIEKKHYSGINFDWVIVRELRFADNPMAHDFGKPLRDLVADVQVQSGVDESGQSCRTTVRLTLAPSPETPERFQAIAAAIEGQFTIPEGSQPTVKLAEFAQRQAPAILMPFLRQAVATATAQSRFGPVLVPPINVIALMAEMPPDQQQHALSVSEATKLPGDR